MNVTIEEGDDADIYGFDGEPPMAVIEDEFGDFEVFWGWLSEAISLKKALIFTVLCTYLWYFITLIFNAMTKDLGIK